MSKLHPITQKSKNILRAMISPDQPDVVPWSAQELQSILEHQLKTELAMEMHRLAEANHCTQDQIAPLIDQLDHATFASVLNGKPACLHAIEMIKEYAKMALTQNCDLPGDVARVLYVMAILSGLQAGNKAITSLDDTNLNRQIHLCLTMSWLPNHVRDILRSASSLIH